MAFDENEENNWSGEVYTYEDLLKPENEEIKEKVIEKLYDINTDYEWYEPVIEIWETHLEDLGFIEPKIQFTGFGSQGDGASFTSSYFDLIDFFNFSSLPEKGEDFCDNYCRKLIKDMSEPQIRKAIEDIDDKDGELYITLNRISNHYSHENTVAISWEINNLWDDEYDEEKVEKFIDYLDELRIGLCNLIYNSLEEEYDYLTSEESILETIQANDYEFDEDGNII